MIFLKDIFPLSDFLRNTKKHVSRLEKSAQPEVLTVNGKAAVVVLSADAFQRMLADLETAEILNTAHQGVVEMFRAGQISADELRRQLRPVPNTAPIPVKEAFAELRRKIQANRKKKAS